MHKGTIKPTVIQPIALFNLECSSERNQTNLYCNTLLYRRCGPVVRASCYHVKGSGFESSYCLLMFFSLFVFVVVVVFFCVCVCFFLIFYIFILLYLVTFYPFFFFFLSVFLSVLCSNLYILGLSAWYRSTQGPRRQGHTVWTVSDRFLTHIPFHF